MRTSVLWADTKTKAYPLGPDVILRCDHSTRVPARCSWMQVVFCMMPTGALLYLVYLPILVEYLLTRTTTNPLQLRMLVTPCSPLSVLGLMMRAKTSPPAEEYIRTTPQRQHRPAGEPCPRKKPTDVGLGIFLLSFCVGRDERDGRCAHPHPHADARTWRGSAAFKGTAGAACPPCVGFARRTQAGDRKSCVGMYEASLAYAKWHDGSGEGVVDGLCHGLRCL